MYSKLDLNYIINKDNFILIVSFHFLSKTIRERVTSSPLIFERLNLGKIIYLLDNNLNGKSHIGLHEIEINNNYITLWNDDREIKFTFPCNNEIRNVFYTLYNSIL